MRVLIKKLKPEAILPTYSHPGDAGLDLYALEDKVLEPGQRHNFMVGFALEFDSGFAAIVKDRGSTSHKYGLHVIGGVYDAGYRGEYNVELVNLGQEVHRVSKGDRIAQLVIFPVAMADLEEVKELSESSRGEGRFGSTGK